MEKKKEYSNGELTVVWKPGLCIHSAKCVNGLPEVFKPKEKPWIQAENAATSALKGTIDRCPSGALSYYLNNQDKSDSKMADEITKIEILDPGPLVVSGNIEVTHPDGTTETRKRNTAFCRCGRSGNQPLCDGSHNS